MTAKTLLFAAALCAAAFSSCATHRTPGDGALRTGDLVFVGIPADYSLGDDSMAGAIGEATGDGDSLNIIHVAILEVAGDSTWIIDATIKRNVDRHPLDTFIRDFTLKDGSLPTFIIKRLKDPSGADKFVENAKSHLLQRARARLLCVRRRHAPFHPGSDELQGRRRTDAAVLATAVRHPRNAGPPGCRGNQSQGHVRRKHTGNRQDRVLSFAN